MYGGPCALALPNKRCVGLYLTQELFVWHVVRQAGFVCCVMTKFVWCRISECFRSAGGLFQQAGLVCFGKCFRHSK